MYQITLNYSKEYREMSATDMLMLVIAGIVTLGVMVLMLKVVVDKISKGE